MRVHYLQHAPFEGYGRMDTMLWAKGHGVSCSPLYASGKLSEAPDFDALIVMGGPMSFNDEKEIGWLPVEGLLPSRSGAFTIPSSMMAFHWHGEAFDLPPEATRLARSAACENQAFQIGRRTIGLQSHLETTPESARLLVENCRSDLAGAGRDVQDEASTLSTRLEAYNAMAVLLENLLAYLLE
jgi:GMP synthase-like glutamine amidotransferase